MIVLLWLEASTVEDLVSLVRVALLEKNCLERLFPFLVGTSNQDAFCLRRC